MPEANLEKSIDIFPAKITEEVREIVVLLPNPKEIKNHAAITVAKHVADTTSRVGPQRHRHDVEHRFDLFVKICGTLGAFET